MSADVYSLIRQAIEARRQVHATYDGHRRRLCPHVIGTTDGRPRALFFQFDGASRRGLEPGGDWRCLLLDELSAVSVHGGPWYTKPHSQPQSCVDEVDLAIDG